MAAEYQLCYLNVCMCVCIMCVSAAVFSFSKKDCEAYAMQMARLDFNSDEEKELVILAPCLARPARSPSPPSPPSPPPTLAGGAGVRVCDGRSVRGRSAAPAGDPQPPLPDPPLTHPTAPHPPKVVTILPLLKRGVGIHHGGLLPILKGQDIGRHSLTQPNPT